MPEFHPTAEFQRFIDNNNTEDQNFKELIKNKLIIRETSAEALNLVEEMIKNLD